MRAVLDAEPEDEKDWLEWKGSLDLTKPKGVFAVARCILAMGNRQPDHAALKAGGLAYMIVGAEAGNGGVPQGVELIDEVKLVNALDTYLGPEHPVYDARFIFVDGKHVLVVVVEPPKWGDHIWLLWKGYQDQDDKRAKLVPEGSIFVRHGSQSKPASASQIRALEQRSLRGLNIAPAFKMGVEVKGEILGFDSSEDEVASWIAERRHLLLNLSNRSSWPPKVEEHLAGVALVLVDTAARRLAHAGANKLSIRLQNQVPKNLENVWLTLRDTTGRIIAAYSANEPLERDLPEAPTPFEPLFEGALVNWSSLRADPLDLSILDWEVVREEGSPMEIKLKLGNFIQVEDSGISTDFHLFIAPGDTSPLGLDYTIRTLSLDTVMTGTLEVPVVNRSIRVSQVIGPENDLPTRPEPPTEAPSWMQW
ncbi:AlbA family DNA-binding domain-containing protein [Kineococcus sp. SYSU DK006]|uniref:AlbA family DNA-binding domain-containing protein n=1 Tax=Kineococcus sp. SYSU DK006 TaxID=3383127 RepID=UPI003D7C9AF6